MVGRCVWGGYQDVATQLVRSCYPSLMFTCVEPSSCFTCVLDSPTLDHYAVHSPRGTRWGRLAVTCVEDVDYLERRSGRGGEGRGEVGSVNGL